VTLWGWLAALVLFLQLPIPLYWFVVHPNVNFWRRHPNATYAIGLLFSWLPVTAGLVLFSHKLFRRDGPTTLGAVVGLGLIAFEGWLFWSVHRELGTARMVGKTEISGSGEIADCGIYGAIRHPRYLGSFLAIVGACLIAGTRTTWIVAAIWASLTLLAIFFEERELTARFGDAYEQYRRRVPRFIPLRQRHPHV
jgi:protein-S-isoprenylcysteine O-methyltransferase Ste14